MPLKFMVRCKQILILLAAVALGAATTPDAGACSQAIERPASLNGPEIAAGYNACKEERRTEDAAFLLLLGKIRAGTDLSVLAPSDNPDMLELPSMGAGLQLASTDMDPDFTRDVTAFDRVTSRVREVRLSGPPGYEPGWKVAATAKPLLYDQFLNGIRESVLETETYLARLLRDDRYYAAYVERMQIVGKLQDGDQLDDRYGELGELMLRVVEELGEPPSTGPHVPWRLLYEPGPQSGFVQLYAGANGPADFSNDLFFSEQAVRASWVADAVEPSQLDAILRAVDFQRDVLVSHNLGMRQNVTFHAYVTEFGWDEDWGDRYSVSSRIGVVDEECGQGIVVSHPFLLAKAPRSGEGSLESVSTANYPDECGPVMRGSPTPHPEPVVR